MRFFLRVLVYLTLAVALTWPTALHTVTAVPGAGRSDLWDGLWSLWFPLARLQAGEDLLRVDGLLNHPAGGSLWVADPLNALLGLPLVALFGAAAAWSVLAIAHVTFAGLAADTFARRVVADHAPSEGALDRAGLVAGVAYASAPMLLAHLHNGATEAVGTGWLALAGWALWKLRGEHRGRDVALAGGLLAVTTVAHAYAGVCGFLLAGVTLLATLRDRASARGMGLALLIGVALSAGPAALAWRTTTAADSVVGIKNPHELAMVRRTIGPADPIAFVMPGDYRSPDFAQISRYGEQFVHTPYLGAVLLLLSGVALATRAEVRGRGALATAGLIAAVLACGPVLVHDAGPVILARRLAVPLPWFLVEELPGLRGLTLLWRLGQLPALVVAVLAAVATLRMGRAGWLVLPAVLLEVRLASPARGLPAHADATPSVVLDVLAEAPEGAVMTYPVTGGMNFLWEQTVHGHPLASSLNFPNNPASRRVWKAMLAAQNVQPDAFRATVAEAARAEDIRYLLVHLDPWARPDLHDEAVRAVKAAYTPVAEADGLRLYSLW